MPKYEVLFSLKHDGKEYFAGDTVEMTARQAEPLVQRGTIKTPKGEALEPNAGMEPAAVKELESESKKVDVTQADPEPEPEPTTEP